MNAPPTSTTDTARVAFVDGGPLPYWLLATGVLAVGLIAALCTVGVDHTCSGDCIPVEHAEPGTPLANYCGTLDAALRWVLLAGLPCLVSATAGLLWRDRPKVFAVVAGVMAAAAIVNTAWVTQLVCYRSLT
jgi:hypothetical protein